MVVAVVQSPSHVQFFVTPWTAAHQASVSFTISWSLLKLMSVESNDAIQPSHLLSPPLSSCPQSTPALGSFPMSWLFASGDRSIGALQYASIFNSAVDDLMRYNLHI